MMNYLKGSVTVFVLLMLGMVIGLYLMGFQSAFLKELPSDFSDDTKVPDETAKGFLDEISGAIVSAFTKHLDIILPMLGFGFLAGLTGGSYAGGSIIQYLILVMFVFIVINIFFFPVVPSMSTALDNPSAFEPLTLILSVIFNALLFLTIFTFVSGED